LADHTRAPVLTPEPFLISISFAGRHDPVGGAEKPGLRPTVLDPVLATGR